MLRISVLAPMIFSFTTVAVCAEDARQLTCEGTMIEPAAMSHARDGETDTGASAEGHPRSRPGRDQALAS